MKMRMVLMAASVAILCSCGGNSNERDRDRDRSERSERDSDRGDKSDSASTNSGASASSTGGTDAQVEQQISLAAQQIQSQAPIRQGPTTITGARAQGMELITAMTLPVDLNDQTISAMQQQLPAQQCSNPQVAQLIQRGGRFTYEITDSNNEVFRVNISSCPGSAPAAQ